MIATLLLALALQTPAPDAVAAPPKPERKICKSIDATGSRLGGARECHTAAEWKVRQGELDARDLNAVNTMKNVDGRDSSPQP